MIGTPGGHKPSQTNGFWWMLVRVGGVCLDGVRVEQVKSV